MVDPASATRSSKEVVDLNGSTSGTVSTGMMAFHIYIYIYIFPQWIYYMNMYVYYIILYYVYVYIYIIFRGITIH